MGNKSLSFILIILSLFVSSVASAQRTTIRLSPEAKVTLLTCSPGDELYSVFGHSAIRVKDPLLGLDTVFNYGTFDFSDPNFYTNFVRGKLNYVLSVAEYRHFEYDYFMEGRWIWEQELKINHREKQYLFDSLIINRLPENRYYLYDFFFDNCATRIRDIFVEAIDREIMFDYQVLDQGQSFRELLMPYLTEKPWARLGINLALGTPADKTATPWDYMFLPDHMMAVFEHARFKSGDDTSNFTPGSRVILEGNELPRARFPYAPLWIFLIVLLATITISYLDLQSKRLSWWYDRLLFGSAGLLGLLITFLWFGTDHQVTVRNLNILWAHPFHLIICLFLSDKRHRTLLRYYFGVNLGLLILLVLSWPVLPQALPWMIIPLIIALVVRSALILMIFSQE
jgi:hypothetical protein